MATMPDLVIEIAEAKELKAGGLYALEIPARFGKESFAYISETLAPFEKEFGVKFILLDSGIRLSEVRPAGVEEIAEAVVQKLREQLRSV